MIENQYSRESVVWDRTCPKQIPQLDHNQRSALATVYQIILDSPHKKISAQLQADGYTVRPGTIASQPCPRLIVATAREARAA